MSVVPKIESADLTLDQLYKDFYTVPDFQREYVWQPENVETLLQDVVDELYDGSGSLLDLQQEYFIGSVVVCPETDGTYRLIDGQQRSTTIFLTLCAIRDALIDSAAEAPDALKDKIRAAGFDMRTGDDVVRYRLALQYEDSDGVLARVANGDLHAFDTARQTASVRNLKAAYQTIREFLAVNFHEDPALLKRFFAAFTSRVKLIRIVTPSLTHALKVFETINDRGVGLNAMDLLKNLLFMETSLEEHRRLKERWQELIRTLDGCGEKPLRFLRYYIMSHHETDWARGFREDEIYKWFVDNKEASGIKRNPIGFVDRLVSRARVYANFTEARDPQGNPNRFLQNISFLSGTARQHFILLLAGQHLPSPLFSDLCRQIENLLFCYIVTRETTKMFERSFARWAGELRAVSTQEELDGFLARYLEADMVDRSKQFDFAFQQLSLDRIQQYRMRYILAKFTQFIEEHAWSNPAHSQLGRYVDKSVDIEHILPRTPTAEARASFDQPELYDTYAQRLGNLTPLEKTINTSISNKLFADKKQGYRASEFLLTKSIAEKPQVGSGTRLNQAVADLVAFEVWNSETIERRQAMLAQLARRVWLPMSVASP
jgi:hypothetical protein